ncbi:DUF5682 family protein [Flexivirga oryzae]|uniref:Uncharacterized protein n=1 Tax=Flexivirga oryzae TaxID=1794944 RepID=A0A839NBM4_9MICO|nr:hypothetical protein [Flexivirga oryzae]
MAAPSSARLEVLGVRHHGPGSARAVGRALDELRPDLVVIEGVPELDQTLPFAASPELRPPVAGLVYAVDRPRNAIFYPLAVFSPEWVAMRWALAAGVDVCFADLPAIHELAPPDETDSDTAEPTDQAGPTTPATPPDPIGLLAEAAGYDDPERWWEDAIEHRSESGLEQFRLVSEAMSATREQDTRPDSDPDVLWNARREAAMRRRVRAAIKAGKERIAFVCGAFHAPMLQLDSFPAAAADNRLLAKLPRTKVAATWAPWTAGRLAVESGYGAGVTSPGWYQHLFLHWDSGDEDVASSWLVRVARELREQGIDASTASVVESARLATTLATLRGRPSVGLSELNDAAEAVLCSGSPVPLRLVHDNLVVGNDLGTVPDGAPMVPLAADLARQQRSTRLKPSAVAKTVDLDLRRDAGRARSVLLHRLRLLQIDWGTEIDARGTGTFRESWELEWRPELAVQVVEASLHGTTVAAAADSRVREIARESDDLTRITALVSDAMVADLPEALDAVVAALEAGTARQHDAGVLLGTIGPLARTRRYGNVRGVDVRRLDAVLHTIVTRASIALPGASHGLDDDAAAALRSLVELAAEGIALLDVDALNRPWRAALHSVARGAALHGSLAGRVNRMLLDAQEIDLAEATLRLSRQLSVGAHAAESAAWLDGFLAGDAALLIYDRNLLAIIDGWISTIRQSTFDDLLPLVHRTFSRFEATDRQQMGELIARLGEPGSDRAGTTYELEQALPAIHHAAELLGLEVTR